MPEILVIIAASGDATDGAERSTSREVAHVAQDIASQMGWQWGKVFVPTDYIDACAEALAQHAQSARLLLMAATAKGKDLMARVAGHLTAPLAQDCVGYRVDVGTIIFRRPLYGGKLLADVQYAASPVLATFRPRTQPALGAAADVLQHVIGLAPEADPRVRVERREAETGRALDVTEAAIVVSGGRGMQGPEHWPILEELVSVLGPRATLACSRPVSDEGWRPRAEHVGQTGRSIAPDVYVAVGISGAIQHVAGIAGSRCIIAINKDAAAPIFEVADYGIVGDLFAVVPALTKAIRVLKAR